MTAEDIKKIIELLPQYIRYFYPGYIYLVLYAHFRACSTREDKGLIIKSLAVSYVFILTNEQLIYKIINHYSKSKHLVDANSILYNVLLICIAVISAYFIFRFTSSRKIEKLLSKIKISTSLSANEIEELEKTYKDLWLVVYLKNSNIIYEGYLTSKELENGKTKYLCLSQYRKMFLNKDNKTFKTLEKHDGNNNEKVVIYFDEVARFELRDLGSDNYKI